MNSNGKKISFGFSKLSKKPNKLLNPPNKNESVELIECLEGAEIKIKNEVEKVEKSPLVIPIKGPANNIVSQIERESLKSKKIKTETIKEDLRPDAELTIEELAARQLLREARNKLVQGKDTTKVRTLPLEENDIIQEGIEPSLDDYENVPIGDFGLALIRGMGWKEGLSMGKNQSKSVKPPEPDLRPKGLGLGAQKIVDLQAKDAFDKNGKKLVLASGAFGKIVAGSHIGKFCEVQFCDEWSGRIVVKASNTNEILTLNELFVIPISKDDYICGSKVINSAKYEQYKQMEENEGPSNNKIVDEMKHSRSFGKKHRTNDSQMKKEEDISRPQSHNRDQFKTEHVDSDISVKLEESSDDEYESEKNKSRVANDLRYKKESKSNEKRSRTRDKYNKKKKSKSKKYDRESSEEYARKSRIRNRSSRSSDSSESYRKIESKTKNREYERGKSEDSLVHYNRKKSQRKNKSESGESSEERHRIRSKDKNRSKLRSSSEEYDNKYREKGKTSTENSNKYRNYSKDKKRKEKDSSRYSDDEVERKYTRNDDSKEEISYDKKFKRKTKKNKKNRNETDSSSESDYETEKSNKSHCKSKREKHKSRH